MENITVDKCSRANCSCREGKSDLEVGSRSEEPGGMSASRISRLRDRSIEETDLIRARLAGSNRGTGQFGLRQFLIHCEYWSERSGKWRHLTVRQVTFEGIISTKGGKHDSRCMFTILVDIGQPKNIFIALFRNVSNGS